MTERQFAIIICTAVTLCGLALFAAAPGDPLAVHGFIVLAFSIGTIFVVLSGYYAPDPAEERLAHYYDDPIKVGIVLAMVWAVFAMFIGVWVALLLAYPEMTFDAAWSRSEERRVGKSVSVSVDLGGRRCIKKKTRTKKR